VPKLVQIPQPDYHNGLWPCYALIGIVVGENCPHAARIALDSVTHQIVYNKAKAINPTCMSFPPTSISFIVAARIMKDDDPSLTKVSQEEHVTTLVQILATSFSLNP
jgi:hypothetical protein